MGAASSAGRLRVSVILPINVAILDSVLLTDASTNGAALGHSVIVLQFFLAVRLVVLVSYTRGYELVEGAEGTVISDAPRILLTSCPDSFVSVARLDVHLSLQGFVGAVHERVNLRRHILQALLREVRILEGV